jgi:hypothetical protein
MPLSGSGSVCYSGALRAPKVLENPKPAVRDRRYKGGAAVGRGVEAVRELPPLVDNMSLFGLRFRAGASVRFARNDAFSLVLGSDSRVFVGKYC